MGLFEEIGPTKCNYLTIGREVPLRLSFSPDGSGTPIPVSKLVKALGVQTDHEFSPSAQCADAANNASRLIFMVRRSFQYLSKSASIPLYGALVRPHLEYGMPACSLNLMPHINHSKISYTVGKWHSSPSLRRETAAVEPSLLAAGLLLLRHSA